MRDEVLEAMVRPGQDVCKQLDSSLPMNWVLMFALTAPHFLNAFVWMSAATWKHFFDRQGLSAVDQFAAFSTVLKAGQMVATVLWVWTSRADGLCFDVQQISLTSFLSGLMLLAVGCSLSAGVVHAIGKDAVFYGARIGEHPHYHADSASPDEWPFNAIQHPQHVGPALIVWAPVVVLWTQLPPSAWFVATFWSTLYVLNWVIEDWF